MYRPVADYSAIRISWFICIIAPTADVSAFVCSMTMAPLADTSAVGAVNRPLHLL